MTFGLFLPPAAERGPVPVLWFLSGLTCTHENAMVKAGAQGWAARAGIAVVFPDTSPRGEGVADHPDFDLGQGAGFYVNATEAPWAPHFRMWDYVTEDLPRVLFNAFPLDEERQGITGHSMGGHGALTVAMRFPERFASVSAFAPIAHPTGERLGTQAVRGLSRAGRGEPGRAHDATLLMRRSAGFRARCWWIRARRTSSLHLLRPRRWPRRWRRGGRRGVPDAAGYDHSYFFVASVSWRSMCASTRRRWGVIYVDADACPVKAEVEAVATRLGVPVRMVSNGGIRPSENPLVEMVYVAAGPDEADKWIAERAGPGDVVVTGDVPLAREMRGGGGAGAQARRRG
jgi:S-formylglutathione hydrolase